MADTNSELALLSLKRLSSTVDADGFKPIPIVATITIDADVLAGTDDLKLFSSCPHAYVWKLALNFTDLDTSSSPTLDFTLQTRLDSDATPTDEVTGITAGQTGATYDLPEPISLHNQSLWLVAATGAATAAAGSAVVKALIIQGVHDGTSFAWKG